MLIISILHICHELWSRPLTELPTDQLTDPWIKGHIEASNWSLKRSVQTYTKYIYKLKILDKIASTYRSTASLLPPVKRAGSKSSSSIRTGVRCGASEVRGFKHEFSCSVMVRSTLNIIN